MNFGKFILLPCVLQCTVPVFAEENMRRSFFDNLLNSSHLFGPASSSYRNNSDASPYDGFKNFTNELFPFRMKRSVEIHNSDEDHPEEYSRKHDDPSNTHNGNVQVGSSARPGASWSLLNIEETSCNNTEPASTCHSCRETITCNSDHKAVIRQCIILLPFCNHGYCSWIPGDQCFEKPATTTSASMSTSTSTNSPSVSTAITTSTTTPIISSTKPTSGMSATSIDRSSTASITPNVAAV